MVLIILVLFLILDIYTFKTKFEKKTHHLPSLIFFLEFVILSRLCVCVSFVEGKHISTINIRWIESITLRKRNIYLWHKTHIAYKNKTHKRPDSWTSCVYLMRTMHLSTSGESFNLGLKLSRCYDIVTIGNDKRNPSQLISPT